MNDRLRDQCHRHLPVSDVEVAGPRAIPPQRLIGVEELFDMPSLGKVSRQCVDLLTLGGRKEGLEMIILVPLSGSLDELVKRARLAVTGRIKLLGGCIARPAPLEALRRKSTQLFQKARLVRHRDQ